MPQPNSVSPPATPHDVKAFDYFGDRISWIDRLRMQASLRVRRQMYDWFRDQIGGVAGKTILDHGSTPDTEHSDSNCFIQWLLDDGATVYATSPEPIDHLATVFPGLHVAAFPPNPDTLPPIDCVLSSATIEHVGNDYQQVQYCRDLLAIAPQVCLTTPNRYHWLDFHTKLPLIHWLPRAAHRWILRRLGLNFWAQEANLRLLSKRDLHRIVSRSVTETIAAAAPITQADLDRGRSRTPRDPIHVKWCEPKFLGCVSNLAVLVHR
jgi:hypothetical protein